MNNLNSTMIIYILSGLLLFLFSLDQIKQILQNLFISKLRYFVSKSINSKTKSFIFGCLASALIQSSSGTTAIAISLLSCKYIKKKDCLGIIIGANLGTCLTTFIVAINISNISLYLLTLGILSFFLLNKYKKYLVLIIYIGLMLLGLDILSTGFNSIISNIHMFSIIKNIQNSNILSLLFGTLSTAIIQSSSGIIGIVERMYFNNLINMNSSLMIMLGANIGTTFTGYFSTINTNHETKKIINLNLFFNILGVGLFLVFYPLYIKHISYIEKRFFYDNIKLSIAYAHFIFNLISVILGYIFFSFLTRTIKEDI